MKGDPSTMEFQRIGSRGLLFTWMEPYHTNVYVIVGPKRVFVIDTFLGPDPMADVAARLREEGVDGKPFVAFNTHADYDHIWGNQVFQNSLIVAHESALRRIRMQGEEGFKTYRDHMMGAVKLTPPNLVFRKKITFAEDGVEFFYTPGHTGDSSSCFDSVDGVLLPGDNLEAPYPYVNLLNLKEYVQSLEEYTRLDTKVIIAGHDPPQYDEALLEQNLSYIRGIASGHTDLNLMNQRQLCAHYPNAVRLAELYLEKADAKKAKGYYEEALNVLRLLEDNPENEEQKIRIVARLAELLR
jgi:glyoxylase-like metal-dependent hydrolase (beta-lactamase superfamily II)